MSILDFRWRKRKPSPSPPAPEPLPTNRQPIRVTDERDGEILNRGYAYWSNAFVQTDGLILLFVGHADGRPKFFSIDPRSGTVLRLGAMLGYGGTGEGWSFDQWGYIYLCDGPRLRRVHPITGHDTVVLDISGLHPGCRLWQAHASENGLTYSATVEKVVSEGAYPRFGTIVQRRGGIQLFSADGALDESHVSADGRYLLIEEDHGNRIIDLETKDERRLTNAEGALSHLDCGHGYAVGEDDQAGACTYLNLATLERRELFKTWNQGVISVRGGRCIVSNQESISLVALDGSGLTKLVDHGMVGSGYDFMVRANLDPTGRVAMYLSNVAGRMDAYVVPV